MTRYLRALLLLLALAGVLFAIFAVFAVRTTERASKHLGRFEKDFPRWRGVK